MFVYCRAFVTLLTWPSTCKCYWQALPSPLRILCSLRKKQCKDQCVRWSTPTGGHNCPILCCVEELQVSIYVFVFCVFVVVSSEEKPGVTEEDIALDREECKKELLQAMRHHWQLPDFILLPQGLSVSFYLYFHVISFSAYNINDIQEE